MWADSLLKSLLQFTYPFTLTYVFVLRNVKWTRFKSSTKVIIFLSYFVNLMDIMDISLLSFILPAPLGKRSIFEYYLAVYISSSASFLFLFFSYWEKLFAFLLICRSFLCVNHKLTVCFSSVFKYFFTTCVVCLLDLFKVTFAIENVQFSLAKYVYFTFYSMSFQLNEKGLSCPSIIHIVFQIFKKQFI